MKMKMKMQRNPPRVQAMFRTHRSLGKITSIQPKVRLVVLKRAR